MTEGKGAVVSGEFVLVQETTNIIAILIRDTVRLIEHGTLQLWRQQDDRSLVSISY